MWLTVLGEKLAVDMAEQAEFEHIASECYAQARLRSLSLPV